MVDVWARFGDFGALCVGFGVLFGGFGWPLGAQRLDQGPLARRDRVQARCGQLDSGPPKLYADSRKSTAEGQMP